MNSLKAFRSGRGQTSVEYLVLLAIAIVIAVVAVGVLSGFIKIGTATTYKKKGAIYWKSADIGIMDWEIYPTGTPSEFVFQNNKEYQITIDWMSVDGGSTTIDISKTLLPGDIHLWTTSNSQIACAEGGSYSYALIFQFDNLEHGINNKQFEGIEKLTGVCSTP